MAATAVSSLLRAMELGCKGAVDAFPRVVTLVVESRDGAGVVEAFRDRVRGLAPRQMLKWATQLLAVVNQGAHFEPPLLALAEAFPQGASAAGTRGLTLPVGAGCSHGVSVPRHARGLGQPSGRRHGRHVGAPAPRPRHGRGGPLLHQPGPALRSQNDAQGGVVCVAGRRSSARLAHARPRRAERAGGAAQGAADQRRRGGRVAQVRLGSRAGRVQPAQGRGTHQCRVCEPAPRQLPRAVCVLAALARPGEGDARQGQREGLPRGQRRVGPRAVLAVGLLLPPLPAHAPPPR
jgi:hypothetical protein